VGRELNAEDRWAISEILSLHGHLFDGGHLDRLEEIFTPDVVYDLSDAGSEGTAMTESLVITRVAAVPALSTAEPTAPGAG